MIPAEVRKVKVPKNGKEAKITVRIKRKREKKGHGVGGKKQQNSFLKAIENPLSSDRKRKSGKVGIVHNYCIHRKRSCNNPAMS